MAYKVEVSERVQQVLGELAKTSAVRCRELALLLLSLEKTPQPEGSRPLQSDAPEEGERVWLVDRFEILYRVDVSARTVEVGVVDVK